MQLTFRSHQIILSDSDHVDLIESGCELLCFTLFTGSSKIRFNLVYRPPNSSLRIDLPAKMLALTRLIDKFTAISYTTVLLGDFNVPEIDWFNLSFKQNKLNSILVNCISTNAMSQFVNTPSRSSRDCDNILAGASFGGGGGAGGAVAPPRKKNNVKLLPWPPKEKE